ncbi:MAG: hypothetical protein PVJ27_00055 [Candidatus Brocadiaceae bacterium]|jgi:hypothetical protein
MKIVRKAALVAFAAVVTAALSVAAQEETPEGREVKVPVKQYKALAPADVYRAAIESRQANVRFRDAFVQMVDVPPQAQQIELGGYTHSIIFGFRTEGDLICAVPSSGPNVVRTFFGIPQDRAIPAGVLQAQPVLNAGQQMTVEGTVVGTFAGQKYVLVDAVYLGAVRMPRTSRELHLFLPGKPEAEVVTGPGTQTFEFPCSHAEGETEALTVTVQALRAEEVAAQVANLIGQIEGLSAGAKTYGQYSAGTVYRHAGADNRINVDFTDRVGDVLSPPLPQDLATAPTLRRGMPTQVQIERAFGTVSRVTCLVPATWPTLRYQAARLLPGERLRIRGTTIGPRGARNCVLVDYIGFPDEQEARGDAQTWWVRLQAGEQERGPAIWDYGLYSFSDLPCRHAPGRFESVRVLLSEFRTIQVPSRERAAAQPPAEPAEEQPERLEQ